MVSVQEINLERDKCSEISPCKINVKFVISDMDECTSFSGLCHADAICQNTVGSFTCTCKAGFTGDGRFCVGKKDCANEPLTPKRCKTLVISLL